MEIRSAESFLAYFEGIRGRTMRLFQAVPADRIEWRHSTGFAFMERMHVESVAILKELTPEDLERKGRGADGSAVTAWKLLRAMVEHEIHHRGEMYVYLAVAS